MAAASSDTETPGESKCRDPVSMSQLITELSKQQINFKDEVATLIQGSIWPLQASMDGLRDEVSSFQVITFNAYAKLKQLSKLSRLKMQPWWIAWKS